MSTITNKKEPKYFGSIFHQFSFISIPNISHKPFHPLYSVAKEHDDRYYYGYDIQQNKCLYNFYNNFIIQHFFNNFLIPHS